MAIELHLCCIKPLIFPLDFLFHWNGNVFMLMKFSWLATLEVVKITNSSAAGDENFIKMTTFSFQWYMIISASSFMDFIYQHKNLYINFSWVVSINIMLA